MPTTNVKTAMPDEVFVGERLQIARDFRGFTQKKLSEDTLTSRAFICQLEGQKKSPTREMVDAFASVLGFQPSFFYQQVTDAFLQDECSFRHQRSMSERMKMQIRAHGTLVGMVVDKLRSHLQFPELRLPSFSASTDEEIEQAAERSRKFWNLDANGPINQIGRVLEHAGVIIVSHVVPSTKVDAFSRQGKNCIIFLNKQIPSRSRWIFDVAHEAGHLVMHNGVVSGSVETERAADRFASAFLMPRNAFSREFKVTRFSWEHVFSLKKRWRTSAAAIIRRAYDLKLIGPVQYRQAHKYMSFKGWKKGEPYEPPFQEPELLEMGLNAVKDEGLTWDKLAEELNFTSETFKDVTGFAIPRRVVKGKTVIPFPSAAGAETS